MEINKLILATIFILFYYSFGKKSMILLAEFLVKKDILKSKIAKQELKGVIELVLIVISHIGFCLFFAEYLTISLKTVFQFNEFHYSSLMLGGLLGIGQMSLASTLCLTSIRLLQKLVPHKVPYTITEWVVQSRAGWIKHHFDALKHTPSYISCLLILLQISAEETVFRGLLLRYLLSLSPTFAICFSTFLFVLIQSFLMPRKISSMFPIIGAIVMGITNAVIYIQIPNIYPLIFGHIVFFFFSLLFS